MSSTVVSESTSRTRGPEAVAPGPRAARQVLAKLKRFDFLGVSGVLVILVAWYVVTSLQLVHPLVVPAPADVWNFWSTNFFSSPLIAAQSLGNDGIWGSLIYSSVGIWLSVVISVAIGL